METTNRLLYVDNDFSSRDLFPELFGSRPLEIETCKDGINALTKLQSFPADIVVTGLSMPNMDGRETYSQLRTIDPSIATVLMSGYNEQDATQHFVGKDLAGFLAKPFMVNELVKLVREKIFNATQ